ncbi:hypothetical protein CDD83_8838 [Cordyceps sp. RAO-2017]|nr:hypothetical protein CDD83_8838 [Cordyceps sp. RAO-2017]
MAGLPANDAPSLVDARECASAPQRFPDAACTDSFSRRDSRDGHGRELPLTNADTSRVLPASTPLRISVATPSSNTASSTKSSITPTTPVMPVLARQLPPPLTTPAPPQGNPGSSSVQDSQGSRGLDRAPPGGRVENSQGSQDPNQAPPRSRAQKSPPKAQTSEQLQPSGASQISQSRTRNGRGQDQREQDQEGKQDNKTQDKDRKAQEIQSQELEKQKKELEKQNEEKRRQDEEKRRQDEEKRRQDEEKRRQDEEKRRQDEAKQLQESKLKAKESNSKQPQESKSQPLDNNSGTPTNDQNDQRNPGIDKDENSQRVSPNDGINQGSEPDNKKNDKSKDQGRNQRQPGGDDTGRDQPQDPPPQDQPVSRLTTTTASSSIISSSPASTSAAPPRPAPANPTQAPPPRPRPSPPSPPPQGAVPGSDEVDDSLRDNDSLPDEKPPTDKAENPSTDENATDRDEQGSQRTATNGKDTNGSSSTALTTPPKPSDILSDVPSPSVASPSVALPPQPRPDRPAMTPGSDSNPREGEGASSSPSAVVAEPVSSTETPSQTQPLGDTETDNDIAANPPQDSNTVGGGPKGPGNSGNDPELDSGPNQASGLSKSTIAGISAGSFAVVLLLAVLFWFLRKSMAKRRENRIPSPFSRSSSQRRGGDTASGIGDNLGAEIRTEKPEPALTFLGIHPRSRATATNGPMVDENQGSSQFWEASAIPRDEPASYHSAPNVLTMKDRVMDWWSRRAEDRDFNTRVRGDQGGLPDGTVGVRNMGVDTPPNNRPELGLNVDGFGSLDPFADINAMSDHPMYARQIVQDGSSNPFADPSAVPTPLYGRHNPAYYTAVSRLGSHSRSQSASVRNSQYSAHPMMYRPNSAARDSLQSVESFADRRNKFRSDPFDLELDGVMPNASDVAQMPPLNGMSSIYSSHTRAGSLPSSHYTSGVSMSDWSIADVETGPAPGPTTSAAGARWYGGIAQHRSGDVRRWPSDQKRQRTGGGVGQAL